MRDSLVNWLKKPNLGKQKTFFICLTSVVIFSVISMVTGRSAQSLLGIDQSISHYLGKNLPTPYNMHDSLKVFTIDTPPQDIKLADWSKILVELDKSQPKVILTDFHFNVIEKKSELINFLSSLQQMRTPVVASVFQSEIETGSLGKQSFASRLVLEPGESSQYATSKINNQMVPQAMQSIGQSKWFFGPHPLLMQGFHALSHTINDGYSFPRPIAFDDNFALAHLGLYALADKDLIKPMMASNINSLLKLIHTKSFELKSIALDITRPPSFSGLINDGDVIYLSVKSRQTIETAMGPRPHTLVNASIISNALGNEFITAVPWFETGMLVIFFAILLSFGSAKSFAKLAFTGLGFTLMLLAIDLAFVSANLMIGWVIPLVFFLTTQLILTIEQKRVENLKKAIIHGFLDQHLGKKFIEPLQNEPKLLKLAPEKVIASIMAIEYDGYDNIINSSKSKINFNSIFDDIPEITDIIKSNGGMVFQSSAGSAYAIFGYMPIEDFWQSKHKSKALDCARQISEHNLKKFDYSSGTFNTLPIKIAIHSQEICIGSISSATSINFNFIMDHQEFYSRLLEATGPFTMSTSQYFLSDKSFEGKLSLYEVNDAQAEFDGKAISLYSLNPHKENKGLYLQKIEQHKKALGISRRSKRITIPENCYIAVETKFGAGKITNYSATGINLILPVKLAKGEKIELDFTQYESQMPPTEIASFSHCSTAVRWNVSNKNQCFHGIQIEESVLQKEGDFLSFIEKILEHTQKLVIQKNLKAS